MAKAPTKAQRIRWDRVSQLGCRARSFPSCKRPAAIHHAETGAGGRKNHDKVIGLCHHHHQGEQGIHTLSRRVWQPIYGFERELLEEIKQLLGEI